MVGFGTCTIDSWLLRFPSIHSPFARNLYSKFTHALNREYKPSRLEAHDGIAWQGRINRSDKQNSFNTSVNRSTLNGIAISTIGSSPSMPYRISTHQNWHLNRKGANHKLVNSKSVSSKGAAAVRKISTDSTLAFRGCPFAVARAEIRTYNLSKGHNTFKA
jgi:hypothetical protein